MAASLQFRDFCASPAVSSIPGSSLRRAAQPSGSIWREKPQATPEGNFQNFPRGFDSSSERRILSSFSFFHSRCLGFFPHSACFSLGVSSFLNSISIFKTACVLYCRVHGLSHSIFFFFLASHSFIHSSCPLAHSLSIFPHCGCHDEFYACSISSFFARERNVCDGRCSLLARSPLYSSPRPSCVLTPCPLFVSFYPLPHYAVSLAAHFLTPGINSQVLFAVFSFYALCPRHLEPSSPTSSFFILLPILLDFHSPHLE